MAFIQENYLVPSLSVFCEGSLLIFNLILSEGKGYNISPILKPFSCNRFYMLIFYVIVQGILHDTLFMQDILHDSLAAWP